MTYSTGLDNYIFTFHDITFPTRLKMQQIILISFKASFKAILKPCPSSSVPFSTTCLKRYIKPHIVNNSLPDNTKVVLAI